ncbi:hypothetical protein [Streptomyces microflavus]|uniref:hypothetical protein n=1 Tax=Streptomyces microflavus TaxID=1919 RepID=UPI0033D82570
MDTLSDLPQPEPEQAVIAHNRLSDDQYGSPAEREAIYNAERVMTAAVKAAGVGEVDGNEFGGAEAVLYAYGADAEALFGIMEPDLRSLPFSLAHVVLRRESRESESRVDLRCGTAAKYRNYSSRVRPAAPLRGLRTTCLLLSGRSA